MNMFKIRRQKPETIAEYQYLNKEHFKAFININYEVASALY